MANIKPKYDEPKRRLITILVVILVVFAFGLANCAKNNLGKDDSSEQAPPVVIVSDDPEEPEPSDPVPLPDPDPEPVDEPSEPDNSDDNEEPEEPEQPEPEEPIPVSNNEIIVGVEYAFPGTGKAFADTGMKGIKFFPENYYRWNNMQPDLSKPVDFSDLDDLVEEYQDAGIEEITVGLRYDHNDASVDSRTLFGSSFNLGSDYSPKPEFEDEFQDWVSEFVERYDGDGVNDMPGLKHPITHYEVGVEYSSYTPESGDDYVRTLELAYEAAHQAFPDVSVAHSAFFFPIDAAIEEGLDVDPEDYPSIIKKEYKKIPAQNDKNYEEIEKILEAHEFTDVWNLHSLGSPYEIEHLVRWLRWEEKERGIPPKEIIISDTVTSPYNAFGDGTKCEGITASKRFYPVTTKAQHCEVAEYFERLVEENNPDDLAFARKHTAEDLVKKVVIAASEDIVLINTAFTEDFEFLQGGVFGIGVDAGGGFSGWAGIVDVSRNAKTQKRTVKSKNPGWYALRQMNGHIQGYTSFSRVDTGDEQVRLYKVVKPSETFHIAWFNTMEPVLPDDNFEKTFSLPGVSGSVTVESLINDIGQTSAESTSMSASSITVSETPVFIFD